MSHVSTSLVTRDTRLFSSQETNAQTDEARAATFMGELSGPSWLAAECQNQTDMAHMDWALPLCDQFWQRFGKYHTPCDERW